MKLKELIIKTRSFRRFDEDHPIPDELMKEWIDHARLTASSANRQYLKYMISNEKKWNERIFPYLRWAGYLKDWAGPAVGERPSGYILILLDTRIYGNAGIDPGIAAQTILLSAVESGYGGCMIGSIDHKALSEILELPDYYKIQLVIAMGKPVEKVVLEDIGPDGDIKYWRDENQVHHVPKRKLDDIILKLK